MKMRLFASCLLILAASGCGEKEPVRADENVPVADVPAKIMDVARKELPGYTFDTAFKMKIDGKDAYEVRGKNSRGKTREVEIAVDGSVLRVE